MDFSWLPVYGHYLLRGLFHTLVMVVLAGSFGFAVAVIVGIGRVLGGPVISGFCRLFISVIRGTPLLVQMYLFYVGLGALFASTPFIRETVLWNYVRGLDVFWYVLVALIVNSGAYGAEVVRGALLSVPQGEIAAARAFGFSGWRLMYRIWLPRALQSAIPVFAGETILLLKATALTSVIAFSLSRLDLYGATALIRQRTYLTYEPLLLAALGYILLTLIIEALFRKLERRYGAAFRTS